MPDDQPFDDEGLRDLDEDISDLAQELNGPKPDRVSPWILSAAVIGMLIGFFLWGSIVLSVSSAASGLFDDDSTPKSGAAVFDTISSTSTPEPAATPTPDASTNRLDCDAIRGTDYRSPEERTWFLDNCVSQ